MALLNTVRYELDLTTQGPLYPPSEIMNADGDFVVIGRIPCADGTIPWSAAIVAGSTRPPHFGEPGVHEIVRWFDPGNLGADRDMVLYTLPLPLPANNYPMVFAPEQRPGANTERRPSFPLHEAPIPDYRPQDGVRRSRPITLGEWIAARGEMAVSLVENDRAALFDFDFDGLVPESLYTVMSLRRHDLDPAGPTRPGPLGVPNVFLTDTEGRGHYRALLRDPFPDPERPGANPVINVVVLFMSAQTSYGGAIGHYGLGGDIHAQLKLKTHDLAAMRTRPW